MIDKEMQIHIVLNRINVGKDFLMEAQIKDDEVANVKKCMYQSSIPNINPGTIIIALAIQLQNSIVL